MYGDYKEGSESEGGCFGGGRGQDVCCVRVEDGRVLSRAACIDGLRLVVERDLANFYDDERDSNEENSG